MLLVFFDGSDHDGDDETLTARTERGEGNEWGVNNRIYVLKLDDVVDFVFMILYC